MWVSQQKTNREVIGTQQDKINLPLQRCDWTSDLANGLSSVKTFKNHEVNNTHGLQHSDNLGVNLETIQFHLLWR